MVWLKRLKLPGEMHHGIAAVDTPIRELHLEATNGGKGHPVSRCLYSGQIRGTGREMYLVCFLVEEMI